MLGMKKVLRCSKRKHADQSNLPTKKQRSAISSTKITDVNVDCLEKIFEHLNLTDLNNVAETDVHFFTAARLVYKRLHVSKTVKIYDSSHMVSVYEDSETDGHIVDATATSFLANFGNIFCFLCDKNSKAKFWHHSGDLVQTLRLDYTQQLREKDNRHHWRRTERAIFKHCTKTLTEIHLINCHGNVLEEIRQPFENVTNVYIYDFMAEPTTVKLTQWFPNTIELELECAAVAVQRYAKGKFRLMVELRLSIRYVGVADCRQNDSNIRKFLRSNRQITELYIDSLYGAWLNCDIEFIYFISKTLTQLEKMRWDHLRMFVTKKTKNIHFERVKSFELQTVGELPEMVNISFGQLESLNLYGISANDKKWTDFIVQNERLVELGYFPTLQLHDQTADNLLKITTKLPNLKTIDLQADSISPQQLGQFLRGSSNLTKYLLKFFAGFKNDLDEYLSVVDERYLTKEVASIRGDVITSGIITLMRILNDQQ